MRFKKIIKALLVSSLALALTLSIGSIAFAVGEQTATFVSTDRLTGSAWEGNYGELAYMIPSLVKADGVTVANISSSTYYTKGIYEDGNSAAYTGLIQGTSHLPGSGLLTFNGYTDTGFLTGWTRSSSDWALKTGNTAIDKYSPFIPSTSPRSPSTGDFHQLRLSTPATNNLVDSTPYVNCFGINDDTTRFVSIYTFDYDNRSSNMYDVKIYKNPTLEGQYGDLTEEDLLASQTIITGTENSAYVTFEIQGAGYYMALVIPSVPITRTDIKNSINGIFFDTVAPTGLTSTIEKVDSTLGSNWLGTYGADGYVVLGNEAGKIFTKGIFDSSAYFEGDPFMVKGGLDGNAPLNTHYYGSYVPLTGAYDTNAPITKFGLSGSVWSSNVAGKQVILPDGSGLTEARVESAGENSPYTFALNINTVEPVYITMFVSSTWSTGGATTADVGIYKDYKAVNTAPLPLNPLATQASVPYGSYVTFKIQGRGNYTLSAINAVDRCNIPAVFFDFANPDTVFAPGADKVSVDKTTINNWEGAYGELGYIIPVAGTASWPTLVAPAHVYTKGIFDDGAEALIDGYVANQTSGGAFITTSTYSPASPITSWGVSGTLWRNTTSAASLANGLYAPGTTDLVRAEICTADGLADGFTFYNAFTLSPAYFAVDIYVTVYSFGYNGTATTFDFALYAGFNTKAGTPITPISAVSTVSDMNGGTYVTFKVNGYGSFSIGATATDSRTSINAIFFDTTMPGLGGNMFQNAYYGDYTKGATEYTNCLILLGTVKEYGNGYEVTEFGMLIGNFEAKSNEALNEDNQFGIAIYNINNTPDFTVKVYVKYKLAGSETVHTMYFDMITFTYSSGNYGQLLAD